MCTPHGRDPTYRDAYGQPMLRITVDFPENDVRMANYVTDRAVEIARLMGPQHGRRDHGRGSEDERREPPSPAWYGLFARQGASRSSSGALRSSVGPAPRGRPDRYAGPARSGPWSPARRPESRAARLRGGTRRAVRGGRCSPPDARPASDRRGRRPPRRGTHPVSGLRARRRPAPACRGPQAGDRPGNRSGPLDGSAAGGLSVRDGRGFGSSSSPSASGCAGPEGRRARSRAERDSGSEDPFWTAPPASWMQRASGPAKASGAALAERDGDSESNGNRP